jgi:hypothetical protein
VTTPSRKELALALAGFLVLGAALFGPQVARGGFYWDDWQNSANVHVTDADSSLFASLDRGTLRPVFGYRPVLTILLVVEHWALGEDPAPHLAMAALFGVLTAWALYLLLRTCGLAPLESCVPAALLLVFPWTDSTRLWATASFDTLAVALYLLGAGLAVSGMRRRWPTIASLALYLVACWTYEVVSVAVLFSVALYLCVAPRRDALRRFALDACVVAVALLVVVTGTSRTPQSLSSQVHHAGTLASQAFSLLSRALVPVGSGLPGVVGLIVLVAVCAYGFARGERRWLAVTGLGALCVVAGYTLFVPAAPYYEPLAPGTTNRMNVLAAVGYAVLVYGLVRILVRRPAIAVAVCALIGAGYVVKVANDEGGWQRSARLQAQVLDAVPRTTPGMTYYTFKAATFAAPGVPVFSLPFDLKAAVRLRDHTHLAAAYPILGGTVVQCAPDLVYPTGGTYGRVHGAHYRHAVFVDVRRRQAITIRTRGQCLRERTLLGAGPP